MNTRARILLLIPHLGGGGAARVTAILAAQLNANRFEVHLGVVTGDGAGCGSLPAHVHVHALGARRVRESWPAIWRLVRRIRPDVILSGMAHLNVAVLMLRPLIPRATRILVRQNAEPGNRDAGRLTPVLYRLLYPKADGVICQTQSMAEALAKATGTSANLHVLPNPVDTRSACSRTSETGLWSGPGPHLLAAGRLAPEKGFDLLLRAMALLRGQFPSADLTILGAGPEEDSLLELVRELALEDRVRFSGHVADPQAWFPGASLFVLPSRREGLPNALLEAAAAGLPIAATPARGGLGELLAGNDGVWLARDVSAEGIEHAIATALHTLTTDQRFSHPWIEKFRTEHAVPRYEALIEAALAEGGEPSGGLQSGISALRVEARRAAGIWRSGLHPAPAPTEETLPLQRSRSPVRTR
ncbi:MAG TPA: glycosyltransferase [Terracidiphilus sp.]|jgi:glycosyltransferase involved in cell wall biosynthesis|nr:glycosyltransferase [Terracidiphilus sp.]